MIERASFRFFKSLRDVDFDLDRLTVIVGPNGSGKTSILEGLYLLSRCVVADPKEVLVGRWRPGSVFTKGIRDQGMEIECRDGKNALRLSVTFLWSPTGHELPSDTDRGALGLPMAPIGMEKARPARHAMERGLSRWTLTQPVDRVDGIMPPLRGTPELGSIESHRALI